jgi:hypothetical protein
MKKFITALVFVSISTAAMAQGSAPAQKQTSRRGDVAGYTSRDATVLSMMGWGVALAVGIATLCALIEKNAAPGSSSTNH